MGRHIHTYIHTYLLDDQHGVALDDHLLGAELGGGAEAEDDALVLRLVVGLAFAQILVSAATTSARKQEQGSREKEHNVR